MQGQPGLHSSKFKASQSYMVRSCLRKLHIGGKRGNHEKGMRTLELRKRNTSNDEGDIGGVCSQTDRSECQWDYAKNKGEARQWRDRKEEQTEGQGSREHPEDGYRRGVSWEERVQLSAGLDLT